MAWLVDESIPLTNKLELEILEIEGHVLGLGGGRLNAWFWWQKFRFSWTRHSQAATLSRLHQSHDRQRRDQPEGDGMGCGLSVFVVRKIVGNALGVRLSSSRSVKQRFSGCLSVLLGHSSVP